MSDVKQLHADPTRTVSEIVANALKAPGLHTRCSILTSDRQPLQISFEGFHGMTRVVVTLELLLGLRDMLVNMELPDE